MKLKQKLLTIILIISCILTGCSTDSSGYQENNNYSYDEAVNELKSKLTKVDVSTVNPSLDIYDDKETNLALADIDEAFDIKVRGSGQINLEIAAATELSSEAPDDLVNVWAKKFNASGAQLNGKSVSVTVRQMASGEVLTYMVEGNYRPEVYIPSSEALGKMLESKGFGVIQLTERLAGNTAGILMEKDTHAEFVEKYGEVTVDKVLEASLAGDLTFAYTNPYTSATGLNILATMLESFDPENPLSDTAAGKLLEYQSQAPPVSYTTGVMRNQAAKGLIKAMVMEEQAYHNTPELKNYVYTPAGIRHDHPVYTFDYVDQEHQAAAKLFVDYCLSPEAQKIADEKGFNLHDDYQPTTAGLDGAGYLAAQRIWKTSKDGGKPIIAVFVADVSGSMDGEPIKELRDSLDSAANYIGSDHYIGLISYSHNVRINLNPILYDEDGKAVGMQRFDEMQRAYFSGAVDSLTANGGTATYDAVLVALDILRQGAVLEPDAKLMLFVLSDGDQRNGYSLNKITDIVKGMEVPIYTIGYNLGADGSRAKKELKELSEINEADLIEAETGDIVNQLRNLFNAGL